MENSSVSDLEARFTALMKPTTRPQRPAPALPRLGRGGVAEGGALAPTSAQTPPARPSTPPRSRPSADGPIAVEPPESAAASDIHFGNDVVGTLSGDDANGDGDDDAGDDSKSDRQDSTAMLAQNEVAEQAKRELQSSLENALGLRAQLFEMVGASADAEALSDEHQKGLDEETAETIAELQEEISQLQQSLVVATRSIITESRAVRAWGSATHHAQATLGPKNVGSAVQSGPEPELEPEPQLPESGSELEPTPAPAPKLQAPPLLPPSLATKHLAWRNLEEDPLDVELAGLGIRELRKRALAVGVDHDQLEDATFGSSPTKEVIALIKSASAMVLPSSDVGPDTVAGSVSLEVITARKEAQGAASAISTAVSIQHAAPPPTPTIDFDEIEVELANEGETGYGLDIAPGKDGLVEVTAVDSGSRAETLGVLVGDLLVGLGATSLGEHSLENERGEQAIDLVFQLVQEVRRTLITKLRFDQTLS